MAGEVTAATPRRESGVLAHVSSLPGPFGMGEIGPQAMRFVDILAQAGQSVWQVLPLSPAADDGCPYSSTSSAACDDRLVSIELLLKDGLLTTKEVSELQALGSGSVDYSRAYPLRAAAIRLAARRFLREASPSARADFARFRAEAGPVWLDDYALFVALKRAYGDGAWTQWPASLAQREPRALEEARDALAGEIEAVCAAQHLFGLQWRALRVYGRARGVRIFGDMPIYVSHDSCDVWARPDLFQLDGAGRPSVVAGCPPDMFAATGQRWGNPIYAWDRHRSEGFAWWIWRMRRVAELCDIVRIDHFRAFAAYWEIPADSPTAETGRWVEAPGAALFTALRGAAADVDIVAEDLGHITPDVYALRDAFGLPGMRIIQAELETPPYSDDALPERYPAQSVAYLGTHDNDTALGWLDSAPPATRQAVLALCRPARDRREALMRLLAGAGSALVVHQMQDVLSLGGAARMNVPGTVTGNWMWRFGWDQVDDDAIAMLAQATRDAGRGHTVGASRAAAG